MTPQIRNLLLIGLAATTVSFLTAFALQPSRPAAPPSDPGEAIGGWLRLMPAQMNALRDVDPDFGADYAAMDAALQDARARLAEVFEDPEASAAEIMSQVEAVIAAHDALERRVARYLVSVRPTLTEQQRARLFARCAEGVREGNGRRWRGGWSDGRGRTDETRRGRGFRGGRGGFERGGPGRGWHAPPPTQPANEGAPGEQP